MNGRRSRATVRSASYRWCAAAVLALLRRVGGRAAQTRRPRPDRRPPSWPRVYDAIFDARFADVPALLAQTCPPAPREACQLLDAVALWWQIQLDPYNRSRDAAFRDARRGGHRRRPRPGRSGSRSAPRPGSTWAARTARACSGACCAASGWRRRATASASRTRSSARLPLDPAHAGRLLRHRPVPLLRRRGAGGGPKMLRWLLLLPGGDRAAGLARDAARPQPADCSCASEADYQLHLIYLWYEKQPARALELLAGLRDRHPRNPHFLQATAEIQDIYLDDTAASLRTWQGAARRRATRERGRSAEMAEVSARLGLARAARSALGRATRRSNTCARSSRRGPAAPFGAVARAQLQLGDALAASRTTRGVGSRAYRAAIAAVPARDDPQRIAARARASVALRAPTVKFIAHRSDTITQTPLRLDRVARLDVVPTRVFLTTSALLCLTSKKSHP